MATLIQPQQKHYNVLAEALTADGRVVKRVEARAEDLADVAVAFRLAAEEARQCHLPPARLRLTASRAGKTEVAVTLDEGDPVASSALLDGKGKGDVPCAPSRALVPTPEVGAKTCFDCWTKRQTCPHILIPAASPNPCRAGPRWTLTEILEMADRLAPALAPFSADTTRGWLIASNGLRSPLDAVSGADCRDWEQYKGSILEQVVRTRLSWLH
jgi:hypothetical protein